MHSRHNRWCVSFCDQVQGANTGTLHDGHARRSATVFKAAWDFFQYQVLGMHWLNDLVGKGLSTVGIDMTTRLGGSIQFFMYDTVKILVLLSVLIFTISYIQSYFPPERTKRILG